MIVACGEALIDFFVSSRSPNHFNSCFGGSPYNVAIGLARLGASSGLCTAISGDLFGNKILKSLIDEGVNTRYITIKSLPTTLSFVALSAAGVPAYAFYGESAADRGLLVRDIPTFHEDVKVLHFGSYSLVCPPASDTYLEIANQEAGRRLISLDPNVRLTVEPNIDIWRDRLEKWLNIANLVKVSFEDLELLFPESNPIEVAKSWISPSLGLVIVTLGEGGAVALTSSCFVRINAAKVAIIDTVGAGDSFQAALLYQLLIYNLLDIRSLYNLTSVALERILSFACAAGTAACSRQGADLPRLPDIEKVLEA